MFLIELNPFSRKEGNPRDPSTVFRTEVVNIYGSGRFKEILDPKREWLGELQPELTFSTVIAPEKIPEEVRSKLGLRENLGPLKICFGIQSKTDPETGSDNILLCLAEEGAEKAIVMSAQLKRGHKWDMKTSVYTKKGKSSSPFSQDSVFAETARLARECAELELRSRQTA